MPARRKGRPAQVSYVLALSRRRAARDDMAAVDATPQDDSTSIAPSHQHRGYDLAWRQPDHPHRLLEGGAVAKLDDFRFHDLRPHRRQLLHHAGRLAC